MRWTFLAGLGAMAAAASPLAAQPAQRAPDTPPRLVVVIAVDQLGTDLFQQYRPYFSRGLRRLAEGAVFANGYQAHAATETCPGHSTILTGARPARTGIIANTWFNPSASREDKAVYCAEDPTVPGSSSRNYTASVNHLRVPALGEYMRRANAASRTVSIAGKDRAALMMAGRDPAQVWWWGGEAFVSHAGRAAPRSVSAGNEAVARSIAAGRPPLEVPAHCTARARPVPIGSNAAVGANPLGRAAGNRNAFRASPDFDGAVLAIGAALQRELRLGQGSAPDLLILGLSATDYVGHTYGTQGLEMCLQLAGLDRELGAFFARLDEGGVDYAVVLTADHGGNDLPERQRHEGAPHAARVDASLGASTLGRALGQRLGLQGPVLYGDGAFGDIYVDRALTADQRRRVIAEATAAYRAHPQVAAVFTREELSAAPLPSGDPSVWSLLQRARASFDAERSGDFVVLLRPAVTPIVSPGGGYVATHGSPYDYDRRVPILFWRRGLASFEQPLPVETVDILPTLAALLRLPLGSGGIDGVCRDIIAGPATSCR
jgi:hypothetical protein